jgi:hypothetical protein
MYLDENDSVRTGIDLFYAEPDSDFRMRAVGSWHRNFKVVFARRYLRTWLKCNNGPLSCIMFEIEPLADESTTATLTPSAGAVPPGAPESFVSTGEPSASEPSTSESSASEPSTSEPSASEPSASEPSASEPSASEPSASERSASEMPVEDPVKYDVLVFELPLVVSDASSTNNCSDDSGMVYVSDKELEMRVIRHGNCEIVDVTRDMHRAEPEFLLTLNTISSDGDAPGTPVLYCWNRTDTAGWNITRTTRDGITRTKYTKLLAFEAAYMCLNDTTVGNTTVLTGFANVIAEDGEGQMCSVKLYVLNTGQVTNSFTAERLGFRWIVGDVVWVGSSSQIEQEITTCVYSPAAGMPVPVIVSADPYTVSGMDAGWVSSCINEVPVCMSLGARGNGSECCQRRKFRTTDLQSDCLSATVEIKYTLSYPMFAAINGETLTGSFRIDVCKPSALAEIQGLHLQAVGTTYGNMALSTPRSVFINNQRLFHKIKLEPVTDCNAFRLQIRSVTVCVAVRRTDGSVVSCRDSAVPRSQVFPVYDSLAPVARVYRDLWQFRLEKYDVCSDTAVYSIVSRPVAGPGVPLAITVEWQFYQSWSRSLVAADGIKRLSGAERGRDMASHLQSTSLFTVDCERLFMWSEVDRRCIIGGTGDLDDVFAYRAGVFLSIFVAAVTIVAFAVMISYCLCAGKRQHAVPLYVVYKERMQ